MTKKMISKWGATREDKADKVDYSLIPTQMLTRLAKHYSEWGKVHWDFNWLQGNEEYRRDMKKSAFRHFIQWFEWQKDEDHAMALVWNIFSYETLKLKENWGLCKFLQNKVDTDAQKELIFNK